MEERNDGSGIRCNEHPDAPHGFMRDASHSAGRYVCECEFWEPPKNKPMTRDEWKEWLAESWAEAQARAHTPDDIKKIKSRWEPVAHITGFHNGHCVIEPIDRATVLPVGMALYRAPTEWVGLTDEEKEKLVEAFYGTDIQRLEAVELRRLHEVNQDLLKALNTILNICLLDNGHWSKTIEREAHEAIAKATGEKA